MEDFHGMATGRSGLGGISHKVNLLRLIEEEDSYYIRLDDGGFYRQRKQPTSIAESQLTIKELIIVKLCEAILTEKLKCNK